MKYNLNNSLTMPREMCIPFDDIVEAIEAKKDIIFNEHNMVIGPTHSVWSDIRKQLNGEISEKSLYTILKCNRNDVHSRIRIKPLNNVSKDTEIEEAIIDLKENNLIDSETENSSDNENDTINFKITLSNEEWTAMQCVKTYQLKSSRYLQ